MRQAVRKKAVALGFGISGSDQNCHCLERAGPKYRWITAAAAAVHLEMVENGTRTGLRLIFEDQGRALQISNWR